MSMLDKPAIEAACQRLLMGYLQALDASDGARVAAQFAPDGVWIANGRRRTGVAELTGITDGRPPGLVSRHLAGSILVTVESEDRASSVAYFCVFRGQREPGSDKPMPMQMPFSMGEWHTQYVRTPDGWRIAQQEMKRLFQAE